jgi:hypothetical protein
MERPADGPAQQTARPFPLQDGGHAIGQGRAVQRGGRPAWARATATWARTPASSGVKRRL